MRILVASAALGAAFVLMPAAGGVAPAWSQDFSITNPEAPAPAGSRRDVLRQLQAWWDVHSFYPRHASLNDEGGTVGLHLDIAADGRVASARVGGSSGAPSLDAAAMKTFSGAVVRPMPEGAGGMGFDIALHYVLAHRHDQPVPAGYRPAASTGSFTISNDPVVSPVLEKMLQKTCTGTLVLGGIPNHPTYGIRYYGSKLVFFRKPDGTPWVKIYEGPTMALAPVEQVGKLVSWTGPVTSFGGIQARIYTLTHYTAWLGGGNRLTGCLSTDDAFRSTGGCDTAHTTGTMDFSCAEETVPQIEWSAAYATPLGTPSDPP